MMRSILMSAAAIFSLVWIQPVNAQGNSAAWIDSVSVVSSNQQGITYEVVAIGVADSANGWAVNDGGDFVFSYTFTNIMNELDTGNAIAYWDYDEEDDDYIVAVTTFTIPNGNVPGNVWFTFPVYHAGNEQYEDVSSEAVPLGGFQQSSTTEDTTVWVDSVSTVQSGNLRYTDFLGIARVAAGLEVDENEVMFRVTWTTQAMEIQTSYVGAFSEFDPSDPNYLSAQGSITFPPGANNCSVAFQLWAYDPIDDDWYFFRSDDVPFNP